jgi:uncharacterized protein
MRSVTTERPVLAGSGSDSAPGHGLVAVYRALGDGTRLRILRRLVSGPASINRVSQDLHLAKSTVHEHITNLRAAGLVHPNGRTGFRLESELPDLNILLKEFLGLEMRSQCETCGRLLTPQAIAFICSYECTYCERCAEASRYRCGNCGGELVRRPRRRRARIVRDAVTHGNAGRSADRGR